MIADTGIVPGAQVIPSIDTAGRMHPRGTVLDSLYRVFGKVIDTVVSQHKAVVNINVH